QKKAVAKQRLLLLDREEMHHGLKPPIRAKLGKSNDLLLWRVDRGGGEAILSFITRTSVIRNRYIKDVIYTYTHVCDPGTNRSPALSPGGSSLRTRVCRSTG